ncbi:MAG: hypothetical protein WCI17_11900 [bacterium]
MCQIILQSAEFFAFLLLIDIDLAAVAKAQGCHDCQGRLHQAHYPRKPRGAKCALGDEFRRRFSFCCAVCRHRTTPVSVRFLGRRVYLGVVVALASAMAAGLSGPRTGKLVAGLGVPLLTLRRWRQWWLDDFVRTPLWRGKRALFMPPVDECRLPACLLPCFSAADEAGRWVLLLRFLAPLSSVTAGKDCEGR